MYHNIDYQEPTHVEVECQRVAKLLIYVYHKLGENVPEWIEKESTDIYAKNPDLVPELYGILKRMEVEGPEVLDGVVYDARSRTARDLADWWEEIAKLLIKSERRKSVRKIGKGDW